MTTLTHTPPQMSMHCSLPPLTFGASNVVARSPMSEGIESLISALSVFSRRWAVGGDGIGSPNLK
eukprot:2653497-Amphidinium_carterae.1